MFILINLYKICQQLKLIINQSKILQKKNFNLSPDFIKTLSHRNRFQMSTGENQKIMNLPLINVQIHNEQKKQGFQLIWYYWYLKNFANKLQSQTINSKDKKTQSNQQKQKTFQQFTLTSMNKKNLTLSAIQKLLSPYKQTYHIQAIEAHLQHSLNNIKERAMLSRNDRFFVIQPEQQIHQIQKQIRNSSVAMKNGQSLEQCLEDMIIQLYSYYLNNKNVYLIYKGTDGSLLNHHYENNSISSSIDSTQNRLKMILTHNSSQSRLNTSKDSKGSLNNHNERNERRSYGSLKSSGIQIGANLNPKIGVSKLLEEDSILLVGNTFQSFIGDGQKMQNKIQQMQIIDKMAQFDGLELWNIKYKKIPHTFVKYKKQSWTKCLNLPLMHPSAPKTINQFSILPRVSKLNPSIDKLLPFVSFIKQLQKYFPNLLPSIESIFQYNGLPYVFVQEDNGYGSWKWQTNIGVLCYYVVYGNQQQTLSIKKVQRWIEQNPGTLLSKTIKQMNKRQKQKNKKRREILKNMNSTGINSIGNSGNNTNQQNNEDHVSNSLHMLISRDENSDLAIW